MLWTKGEIIILGWKDGGGRSSGDEFYSANKIRTWDNCNNRSWDRPCKDNKESVDHLLAHCPFWIELRNKYLELANEYVKWKGEAIVDCLRAGTRIKIIK